MLDNIKYNIKPFQNSKDLSIDDIKKIEMFFNSACFFVKKEWYNISSFYRLEFYALYKQSIYGNCDLKITNYFEYKKNIKINNWKDKYGMKKITAKLNYIALYNDYLHKKI